MSSNNNLRKKRSKFPDDWDSNKKNEKNEIFPEIIEPKSDLKSEHDLFLGGIEKKIAREEFIKNSKERLSVIRKFIQALGEISPLVDLASREELKDDEYQERLSSLVSLQSEMVDVIGGEWELDSSKINDKYIISIIANKTSKLIKDGVIKSSDDESRVIKIISKIDDFIKDRPYIGELIENDLLSEDILVNIKSSLFPSSLRFYNLLSSLSSDNKNIYKWLKWQNDLTINLAKDLAFHWDKSANFKDRERMFENSIPHCSEITHSSWIEEFTKNIKTDLSSYDEVSVSSNLKDFEREVLDCDMGYLDHDIYSIEWLKNEVSKYIIDKANSSIVIDSKAIDEKNVKLYFVDYCCKNIAKSWVSTSNKKIDAIQNMLDGMSDEEQSKWIEEEGSKPMALNEVYKDLEENYISKIFENKVNLDEVSLLKKSKSKLAMLWGLSDAVCKIRRVDDEK